MVTCLCVVPATPNTLALLAGRADCERTSTGLVPLTDLRRDTYRGFQGGLYPNGRTRAPLAYRRLGRQRAERVVSRDARGDPNPSGTIGLLSVGMSNAKQEFQAFRELAQESGVVNPDVALVQGAQGGWDAADIADPSAKYWTNIDQILAGDGFNAQQVQVAWLKEAVAGETRPFPEDARALRTYLRQIVRIMRARYPNLRLVFLASRTYGGYATTALNPEPFAYESGFSVKWLIRRDIRSVRRERPWLAWGPYLWTDGTAGRSDGLVWRCEDVATDGTHPSPSGRQKVAELLFDFFASQPPTESWFLA